MSYLLALACVFGISIGQILFKLSARQLQQSGDFLNLDFLKVFLPALIVYAITTVGWVITLQKLDLNKAYPLMALAFVFVPIGSHFFLGEKMSGNYLLGVAILIAGIIVTLRS